MSLPEPPLLIITDRRQACRPLPVVIDAACRAGCRWVSIREKDLADLEQLALAAQLLPLVRRHGGRLTLHGRPQIAERALLDGVHLPAGADPATARALLGKTALIGISVHQREEVRALERGIIDYVLVGPAFLTSSKPGYGPELGRAGLSAFVRATALPLVAVGGVEPAVVADVIALGFAGVAVMGNVMRAPDPAAAAARLLASFGQNPRASC